MWFSWLLMTLLAFPAGSAYKLDGYTFGGGGISGGTSPNYQYQVRVGQLDNNMMVGSSFSLGAGLAFERQSPTPISPTLSNPGNYYNKLKLVVNNQSGGSTLPSDTKYMMAVSDDDFVTTKYINGTDHSIVDSYGIADYQTFLQLGDTGGFDILGLDPGKTYKVKVRSMQGSFSESAWGPTSNGIATVNPTLTFDIDVSASDVATTPPYIIALSNLYPGSVITSDEKVWVSVDTNAAAGGSVFVYGENAGLKSIAVGYTIASVNGDLSDLDNGFGIQISSASQLTADAFYTGVGNIVGLTDTLVRQIFYANSPITSGRGSFLVKAKSDNNTPAASDYTEALTVIVAANY